MQLDMERASWRALEAATSACQSQAVQELQAQLDETRTALVQQEQQQAATQASQHQAQVLELQAQLDEARTALVQQEQQQAATQTSQHQAQVLELQAQLDETRTAAKQWEAAQLDAVAGCERAEVRWCSVEACSVCLLCLSFSVCVLARCRW